jgi:hypothetical protein
MKSILVSFRLVCFATIFSLFSGFLYSQSSLSLDNAIRDVADYFNGRLSDKARIAVLNIQSDYPTLSDYIINGLTAHIVNDDKFIAVERRDMSQLQNELVFQSSGVVSDNTAQSIGQLLGAEVIIRGSFTQLGGLFQLQVQALAVETAAIQGMQNISIHTDSTLSALLNSNGKTRPKTPWFLMKGDESWKHKWLYTGARFGVSIHDYVTNMTVDVDAKTNTSFEAALFGEVQILPLLAVQPELVYSSDTVFVSDAENGNVTVSASTLEIPVLAKLTVRPGIFYLAGFVGPYIAIPLGQMQVTHNGNTSDYDFSSTFGLTGGANAGMKLGPGVLLLDARFSGDFRFFRANDTPQYRRTMFSISLGYNYGFFNKPIAGGKNEN